MYARSLVKMFFINLVTLGIYRLVWLVRTRNALVNSGHKIPSNWTLLAPILVMVVAFIVFIASMLSNSGQGDDMPIAGVVSFILFYLIALAYLPLSLIWFWPYSKAVEAFTGQKISTALCLVAFLLIPDGIDIMIIQDGFNKQLQSSDSTQSPLQTS